ncbi:MAG: trypsin-like serine protease [Gammaproteobacteria bacterium]|nr:trypsin-like serine protease [Gammaproteobacteria bacterium]
MKLQRFLIFALTSILAGLMAAFLALSLFQDSGDTGLQTPNPPEIPGNAPASGPASYASAVKRASPSVVNVYTTKLTVQRNKPFFDDPVIQRFFDKRFSAKPRLKRESSLGSGVIISSDGLIMTNNHVIKDAEKIRVVLSDGRNLQAQIVGTDPDTDLALLNTGTKDLHAIQSGDSNTLQVGDVVLAIGNPFGVGQTVTMGIVGATGRSHLGINTFENFIQTDAAINPGNSGGALINAHGQLVGINTAIFSKSGGSHGIGFAIPVKLAEGVMRQILKHGRVVRGWLGLAGQDMTPELAASFELKETSGVLISGVLDDGPADRAGIKPGDIISRINSQGPHNANEILNYIATLTPGSKIKVSGWRGSKPFQAEVTVAERPQDK